MVGIDARRAERVATWLRVAALPWASFLLWLSWPMLPAVGQVANVAALVAIVLTTGGYLVADRRLADPARFAIAARVFTVADLAVLVTVAISYTGTAPDVWAIALVAPFIGALRTGRFGAAVSGGIVAIAIATAEILLGTALAAMIFRVGTVLLITALALLLSREVALAHDELSRSERWRRQLVDVLAHDLRSPLATAESVVTTLEERGAAMSDEDQTSLLEAAHVQLRRVSLLTDDLLALARSEHHTLTVDPQPTQVRDLCADAASVAAPHAKVEFDVDPELRAELDPQRIEQVLVNLLTNAVRYGRAPIRVSAEPADGALVITVSDQGPGVPAEQLEELFTPFTRSDHPGSTGLGLWVSRLITEACNGHLTYTRNEAGGATFELHLPAVLEQRP